MPIFLVFPDVLISAKPNIHLSKPQIHFTFLLLLFPFFPPWNEITQRIINLNKGGASDREPDVWSYYLTKVRHLYWEESLIIKLILWKARKCDMEASEGMISLTEARIISLMPKLCFKLILWEACDRYQESGSRWWDHQLDAKLCYKLILREACDRYQESGSRRWDHQLDAKTLLWVNFVKSLWPISGKWE